MIPFIRKKSMRKLHKEMNRMRKDIFKDWFRLTGVRVRNKDLFQFEECAIIADRHDEILAMQRKADEIGYPICKDKHIINMYIFAGMKSGSRSFDLQEEKFTTRYIRSNPMLHEGALHAIKAYDRKIVGSKSWVYDLLFPENVMVKQMMNREVDADFK